MTVEEIVEEAIAIADSQGLAGVSMLAVAKRLGCTKMALYRYFQTKADLVSFMLDTGLGRPPETVRQASDWRQAMLIWARELLVRYQAHPWSVDVPIGSPALTRNQMLWLEYALQGQQHSSLALPHKLSLVLLVSGHVAFTARMWRDRTTAISQQGSGMEGLAGVIDPEVLPEVMQVLSGGHLSDENGDEAEYNFGMRCILDGFDALILRDERDPR